MKRFTIRDDFTIEKLAQYSDVLKNLDPHVVKSDKNVARTICKLCDKESSVSVFNLETGDLASLDILKRFVRINETEMNSLGIIDEKTREISLQQMRNLVHTHKIKVENDVFVYTPNTELNLMGSNNLYNCKQIVIKKFDLLDYHHLPALKKILSSFEYNDLATSVIFSPYVAAILSIPIFLSCVSTISDNKFFHYLISRSIFQINRKINYFYFNKITVTLGVSPFLYFIYKYINKPVINNLIHCPPPLDKMEMYKYSGIIGEGIAYFKLQSGAILFNICDIVDSYKGIIFHHVFRPFFTLFEKMASDQKKNN